MPIPYNLAAEIARRLSKGADVADLKEALAPTSHDERPIPPPVPARGETSDDAVQKRIQFLEEFAGPLPHLAGEAPQPGAEELAGNIENLIGMTCIPTGVVGPLRINGLHAQGDFYVPLATSEGALVASYSRGAKVVTLAGGAACLTTIEQVQRAPGFAFDTMAEAIQFAAWVVGEFDQIRDVAGSRTQHGRLVNMRVQPQANFVY